VIVSNRIRAGAVGYLNARPLVYGLEHLPRFELRFDVPSVCARLLHRGAIDIGLIPSIEYLRGGPYAIVPDLAIVSHGPVASVMLYTTKPIAEVRSIAMDASSCTSVALTRVLCRQLFRIQPAIEARGPDLGDMLSRCDAALIIGDNALFLDPQAVLTAAANRTGVERHIEVVDLGEAWTRLTGLPFVYAFWAGPSGVLTPQDVAALQLARDEGIRRPDELARQYLAGAPERQALGARYLRDNIKFHFGDEERAGLEVFFRYAVEAGVVTAARELQFFDAADAAWAVGS
jgi:chorismate dehydratase